MIARRAWHRAVFTAAGAYNLGWGLHALLDPHALFRFADMVPPSHPEVWACLGLVIGLYGVLYLEVARRPERGWVAAAVGLTGKIIGPLGWAYLVSSGRWAPATVVLVIGNDLLWWFPFGLYLHDAWPAFRSSWNEVGAPASGTALPSRSP